jgi:hypothetical protein
MIAVQTLDCYNLYERNDTNSIRLQITMALTSSYLLKKHYDRVILYCDERTAEVLRDSFYTEIRILPNHTLTKYGYGTLSKLYTYSNVEEEYIHFDIDYFLFNKIELGDEIFCAYSETKEKVTDVNFSKAYSGLIDKLKSNYLSFGFNMVDENYAMNMCVFGLPKIYHDVVCEYFKKLDEYTQQHIETIYNTYDKDLPPHWAIEQYLPPQFFLQNNFKIKELREYENYQIRRQLDYIRVYEMKTFSMVGGARIDDIDIKEVLTKYMKKNIGHHLWVSKNVSNVDELLLNVSKEIFPDLYKKINLVLNKHFPKTKKKNTLI